MGLKVDTSGLQSGVRARIKTAERYLRSAKSRVSSIEVPEDFPKAGELRSIANTIGSIESSLGTVDAGVGEYISRVNEAEARNQAIASMLSNMALGGIPGLMANDNPLTKTIKNSVSAKINGVKSNFKTLSDIRGNFQAKISEFRKIVNEQKLENFRNNVQEGINSTEDFINNIISGGNKIYKDAQGIASKVNEMSKEQFANKINDMKNMGDKIADATKDFASELESTAEKIFDESNKSGDSQAEVTTGNVGKNDINSNSSAETSSTGGLSGVSTVITNKVDKTDKVDKASIKAKVDELIELLQKEDITKEQLIQIINKKLESKTDIVSEISDSKSINIKLNKKMDSLIELMKKNNISNTQIVMIITNSFVSTNTSKNSKKMSGTIGNVSKKSENSDDVNKTIEDKKKVIIDKAKDIVENEEKKKI